MESTRKRKNLLLEEQIPSYKILSQVRKNGEAERIELLPLRVFLFTLP